MSPYTADLASLQEVVDRALLAERSCADRLAALDARAQRVRAVWTGAAAEEYVAQHAAWSAGAQQLHAALGALRRVVETAHANYLHAVVANRAMWP